MSAYRQTLQWVIEKVKYAFNPERIQCEMPPTDGSANINYAFNPEGVQCK
jgi:hypothetical protein